MIELEVTWIDRIRTETGGQVVFLGCARPATMLGAYCVTDTLRQDPRVSTIRMWANGRLLKSFKRDVVGVQHAR